MTKRKQRPRKSLDQKAAEMFLQTGVAPDSSEVQQQVQQEVHQQIQQSHQQVSQQDVQPSSDLLADILQTPQETVRFTVDLPKDLHQRLCEVSKQAGVPKTEIVRRLLNKALGV